MEEQNKTNKNHWTKTKVDNAIKKINLDIYGRKRHAALQIKMDDLSIFGNKVKKYKNIKAQNQKICIN